MRSDDRRGAVRQRPVPWRGWWRQAGSGDDALSVLTFTGRRRRPLGWARQGSRPGRLMGLVGFVVVLGGLVGGLLFVAPAGPAVGAPGVIAGERISSLFVELVIGRDGRLAVTETIDYDFGSNNRHGLLVYVPRRAVWLPDRRFYRQWRLGPLSATADGRPAQHTEQNSGDYLVSRVGDPDVTVTGRHRYVLRFGVDGAFDRYGGPHGHDELYWNAVGAGWQVPIDSVRVLVRGPFPVRRATCYQGPVGSTRPCGTSATGSGDQAAFTARGLGEYQAVTVVVALPEGSVLNAGPILVERHDWLYYLGLRRGAGPLLGLLGLAAVLAALAGALAYRTGRDRRHADRTSVLVPPQGVRPGTIGALITKRATAHDVTATIVDLAVRGYLTLTETADGDWRLTKLKDAEDGLRAYERRLLDSLFYARETVTLSTLRNQLLLTRINTATAVNGIYTDLVAQGWYRTRPDRARRTIRRLGWLLLLLTLPAGVVLGLALHLGVLTVGIAVAGLALVYGARLAPARTRAGAAAYTQALSFRRHIRATEADQIPAEKRHGHFSRYLPYAVAFGETKQWAATFTAAAAATPTATSWYDNPPYPITSWAEHFTSTASTIFTTTPTSSSSSGFSAGSTGGSAGDGGGGGGGGSW